LYPIFWKPNTLVSYAGIGNSMFCKKL